VWGHTRKAYVTHTIPSERRRYFNFAFHLGDAELLRRRPKNRIDPISLEALPLGDRARRHRDLIRLDEAVLRSYRLLIAAKA
jgi:hypothetical protein